MPVADFVPAVRHPGKSPVMGLMVAGLVSVPVWALVAMAVTYIA